MRIAFVLSMIFLVSCSEEEMSNLGDRQDMDVDMAEPLVVEPGTSCQDRINDCSEGQRCHFIDGVGHCTYCPVCSEEEVCDEAARQCVASCRDDVPCILGFVCMNGRCVQGCDIETAEGCRPLPDCAQEVHGNEDDMDAGVPPSDMAVDGSDAFTCQDPFAEEVFICVDSARCVGQFNCPERACPDGYRCVESQCQMDIFEEDDASVLPLDPPQDAGTAPPVDDRCFCGSMSCSDDCRPCASNRDCGHPGEGARCRMGRCNG